MRVSIVLGLLILLAPSARAANCKAPRVLLVVDKSSSMLGLVGSDTKWSVATSAITTVVSQVDSKMDFGLMLFPYQASATSGGQCTAGKVNVPIGSSTRTAIQEALKNPPPTGGNYTPMAQSLKTAGGVAALHDTEYAAHVLLITDGWQWCSSTQPAADRKLPIAEVKALTGANVTVHVVGFGASVDKETLNEMAVAAGTAVRTNCNVTADTCYYQADNAQQLIAALNAIVTQVGTEICNGKDDDCDGIIDDNLGASPICSKQQGVCKGATKRCAGAQGWIDCTTADYQKHSPDYEETETKCDGKDNDCDGTIDEGCGNCKDGVDTRPCGTPQVGECKPGVQTCVDGSWSTKCAGEIKPVAEDCDGKDNNCNGEIDENLSRSCATKCGSGLQTCVNGKWGECTAGLPGSEICDGKDNDCDGVVDGPAAICPDGGVCIAGRCESMTIPAAGGCDCDVGDGATTPAAFFVALLGALLLLPRRRRRRR